MPKIKGWFLPAETAQFLSQLNSRLARENLEEVCVYNAFKID